MLKLKEIKSAIKEHTDSEGTLDVSSLNDFLTETANGLIATKVAKAKASVSEGISELEAKGRIKEAVKEANEKSEAKLLEQLGVKEGTLKDFTEAYKEQTEKFGELNTKMTTTERNKLLADNGIKADQLDNVRKLIDWEAKTEKGESLGMEDIVKNFAGDEANNLFLGKKKEAIVKTDSADGNHNITDEDQKLKDILLANM